MRSLTVSFTGAMLLTAVAGCASPVDRGVAEFRAGRYDQAAALWNPLANAGDPVAQNNLAVLWENGGGSTPKNENEAMAWYLKSAKGGYVPAMVSLARLQKQYGYNEAALSWFNLAARWGNPQATSELRAWGKPVPQADLWQAKVASEQRAQQQASDAAATLLLLGLIGAAASSGGGGGGGWSPGRFDTFTSSPQPIIPRQSSTIIPTSLNENPYKYRGVSGATYQYDLSRSTDQFRYELDYKAQMRDEFSLDLRRDIDQGMGQWGGGIRR